MPGRLGQIQRRLANETGRLIIVLRLSIIALQNESIGLNIRHIGGPFAYLYVPQTGLWSCATSAYWILTQLGRCSPWSLLRHGLLFSPALQSKNDASLDGDRMPRGNPPSHDVGD